jgi:hypothetical protein
MKKLNSVQELQTKEQKSARETQVIPVQSSFRPSVLLLLTDLQAATTRPLLCTLSCRKQSKEVRGFDSNLALQ